MNFNLKRPCANCPFRSDIDFFLSCAAARDSKKPRGRIPPSPVIRLLITVVGGMAKIEHIRTMAMRNTVQGVLIPLVKEQRLDSNFLFRLAFLAGPSDPAKLDLDSPVLTLEQFIHKEDQEIVSEPEQPGKPVDIFSFSRYNSNRFSIGN